MPSSTSQSLHQPEGSKNDSRNFLTEYEAVRNFAGLFSFNSFAKISVRGKDRIKFLQGLTTNDMNLLSEGNGLYTIFPTIKGKIASEARVYAFSDHILLILNPDLREKTLQILNKFKIGSDVQILDLTESFFLLSVQGPHADSVLGKWLQNTPPDLLPFQWASHSYEGVNFHIIRNAWSGEMGFDLLIPAPQGRMFQKSLLEKGAPAGLIPVGKVIFETIRIEAGIPQYGAELSEEVLPQEAGLEKLAISYTKGCYIGQETIARLHYLGHTNRSMVGLLLEQDFPDKSDTIVSEDKNIGLITSSAFSPSLKRVISLGYLQRLFLKPGTPVEIRHREGRIKAWVTELPFYRPEQVKSN
ncbi:MAG: YgfZ/GcvT domain-containing protein [Nitrospiria bacterium]